ncbi:hypothetical protein BR63_09100 [Thermanaerosceptrum fracticalcis]|uniref:Uncharacterized protein n=1 Tax=Thermanaerosceptrum fracticalcis TaxID=1712410 RepID=A0A7G6E302_THEFR|nr:hypothetical protein [Thermanaerosceptrum fracticalcis]QNB46456.1 hypothetical protein BR63_09100 [Thermanaerosceptrum fracticalcis]
MLNIVLFIIALISGSIISSFYLTRKSLLLDLKKIQKKGYLTYSETGKLPIELRQSLSAELNSLKSTLMDLQNMLNAHPNISTLQNSLAEYSQQIETIRNKIKETEKVWEQYTTFKNDINYCEMNITSRIYKIKEKSQVLINLEPKYEEIINEKVQQILPLLEELLEKYKVWETVTFLEFDYLLAVDLGKEYEKIINSADMLIKDLELFRQPIQVYITILRRKTVYYITLREVIEGSLVGKTSVGKNPSIKSKRLGEVTVSYNTFKNAYIGKKYKGDVFVSGKRSFSTQSIELKIISGKDTYSVIRLLNDDQFVHIFKALPIKRQFEEVDDNGIPLELNLTDLNIAVCEKKTKDFEVFYHLDIFKKVSIYDFLNSATTELNQLDDNSDAEEIPSILANAEEIVNS